MSFKVEAAFTFMSATSKIDRHAWNERDAIVSVGIWQKISTFCEIIQLIALAFAFSCITDVIRLM